MFPMNDQNVAVTSSDKTVSSSSSTPTTSQSSSSRTTTSTTALKATLFSKDIGELFQHLFRHTALETDIAFTYRELERKRGDMPRRELERASLILQHTNHEVRQNQEFIERHSELAFREMTAICQLIKNQLSKHTNYQEERIQAAQTRRERHQQLRDAFLEALAVERKDIDQQFAEDVLKLDQQYLTPLDKSQTQQLAG
jgi:hypothetical protein